MGREDRTHPDDIVLCYARLSESKLETRQLLLVTAHAFCEECLGRYEIGCFEHSLRPLLHRGTRFESHRVSPLAVLAHTIYFQSMVVMPKAVLVGYENLHAFNSFTRELHHAAALYAYEVFVMALRHLRLISLETFAEVVFLHNTGSNQQVQRAIDGRLADIKRLPL